MAAASAKTVDQHRQAITLTTPVWIDNDESYLMEMPIVAGAGGNTMDFIDAIANFTLKAMPQRFSMFFCLIILFMPAKYNTIR